ncbi:hypothetical protein DFH08DRAFT_683851, partial [Mycena albidolilacea]
PSLCRLYFGTTYRDRAPSRFITTVNFSLNEDRYNVLGNAFANLCPLPVAADVARGMGEMLGRLHHTARVDARDMEFVLGGDGSDGCTYFIIGYNQVHRIDPDLDLSSTVTAFVEAFYQNDAGDPL